MATSIRRHFAWIGSGPGAVWAVLVALALVFFAPVQVSAHAAGGTTGADLQISGSASTGSPSGGAAFTYTFQVKNAGPQTATAATFTDPLNSGVAVSSTAVNGNSAACSSTTDANGVATITCNLGDMASGSQLSVVENATAPAATASEGIYDNTPSVQSSVTDPNPANNQVTVEIKVFGTGGGGTAPPPLANGPCATIAPQNPAPMTVNFSTVTLKATITSCSQLTQPNLVVAFQGGNTTDGYVFTCNAPQSSASSQPVSYSLSPGASTSATCKNDAFVTSNSEGSAYSASGTGTATLYADCQTSGDFPESASDPQSTCSTVLATGSYQWQVNVPIPKPASGRRPL
jgi:uncharacterized repeat protein (TIGR01451 family)